MERYVILSKSCLLHFIPACIVGLARVGCRSQFVGAMSVQTFVSFCNGK
jgi:hypothetical protein